MPQITEQNYDEFVSFCLDYLGINGVYIELDKTSREDWGYGDIAEAYCGQCADFGPLKVFVIEYLDELESDFTAFHKMLAHELTHVMQTMRGDEFRFDLPYEKQPHELEAYAKQEEIWQSWLDRGMK